MTRDYSPKIPPGDPGALKQKKVLLLLLPFWDPQIPPLGLACLKSYCNRHGYPVTTADANVEEKLRECRQDYFALLKQFIPPDKCRHLYNIGHEVLKNHMMAHIHTKDETRYRELVRILIYETFFTRLEDSQVNGFIRVLANFYEQLEKYLSELLEKENPEILGLSVYGGTLAASLFAFRLAKKRAPGMVTVMGGGIFAGELAVGSPNWEFFLQSTPYIDKIIVGEGERLFLDLLQDRLPGLPGLPGLPSKRVYTIEDVNHEPVEITGEEAPDFSDFDVPVYPCLAVYTSRSCPFQCNFCLETIYWGKYRKKSAQQIISELTALQHAFGFRIFVLCDSILNPVIHPLAQGLVKTGLTVYWDGYLRVDRSLCDPGQTLLWRQAGFYRARLGLESGSPRVLAAMGKKITVEQIKTAVSSLAGAGIKTTTMWIVGYPGETEADFRQTLGLIEELSDDIYEADLNPFWYFSRGQLSSEQWSRRSTLLYPPWAKEMLMAQTWIVEGEPSRQETYERVNRLVEHCQRLGVPNPYSLPEIHQADQRWRQLHKNAVPSFLELQGSHGRIDEKNRWIKLQRARNPLQKDETFSF